MTAHHRLLLLFSICALSACAEDGAPVLLASGTYTIESNPSYGGPADADLDGVLLDLDVDALTAELLGTDDDRVMDLTRLPKAQWGESCPMGVNAVDLETFEVQESLTLAGLTLDIPRILASGCHDDKGTTVSQGAISSKEDMETTPSDGPFALRLAP